MPAATALCPYCSARLAVPEPFGLALKLMLLPALSVSVLADQVMGAASVMSAPTPEAVSDIALPPPLIVPLTVMVPTVLRPSAPPTAVTLPLTVMPPALSAMLMAPALDDVVPRLVIVLEALFNVTLAPLADRVRTLVMGADWLMAPVVASVSACAAPLRVPLMAMAPLPAFSVVSTPRVRGPA